MRHSKQQLFRTRASASRATLPHHAAGRDATAPPAHAAWQSDYVFLAECGIAVAVLDRALIDARLWDVPLHRALLSRATISEAAYTQALARRLKVGFVAWDFELSPHVKADAAGTAFPATLTDGLAILVIAADEAGPCDVAALIALSVSGGRAVYLTSARGLGAAVERATRKQRLRHATFALHRQKPELSAGHPVTTAQWLILMLLIGVAIGGAAILPAWTLAAVIGLLALPFAAVVLVRLVAMLEVFRSPKRSVAPPLPDADLPTYSVLVPIFDEAEVLHGLIAGLVRVDYPPAKLDIALVLEEVDVATKAALIGMALPPQFRILVVPDGMPRTKPKALNYAMLHTHGEYVVVFDAEDRPEPDQLRRAAAAFADGETRLACVQARLNIYNIHDSWFSRQFTVEYSALFDAILPALDRLGLPVPLGGTSNHFPRAVLDEIGGWDPFNVTEDADLGIRLARLGWHTAVLDSTTWEEAPRYAGQWLRQRTRWLKGWMQTYSVHIRHPIRLTRELGFFPTLGFHAFMGGLVLSTLVHPWFFAVLAWMALSGDGLTLPDVLGPWLGGIATATLVLGYATVIIVGVVASYRRGHGLFLSALQMPLCWLLVSLAAYRALWQLWRDPFKWEKTTHGHSSFPDQGKRRRLSGKRAKPHSQRRRRRSGAG